MFQCSFFSNLNIMIIYERKLSRKTYVRTASSGRAIHSYNIRKESDAQGERSWERPWWSPKVLYNFIVTGARLELYRCRSKIARAGLNCEWCLNGLSGLSGLRIQKNIRDIVPSAKRSGGTGSGPRDYPESRRAL